MYSLSAISSCILCLQFLHVFFVYSLSMYSLSAISSCIRCLQFMIVLIVVLFVFFVYNLYLYFLSTICILYSLSTICILYSLSTICICILCLQFVTIIYLQFIVCLQCVLFVHHPPCCWGHFLHNVHIWCPEKYNNLYGPNQSSESLG